MKKQTGYSIIAMMIGLAIGIIVLVSAGAFFMSTLRSNVDEVKQQNFEQSIQIIKSTMVAGIRRAGYSNSASSLPDVAGWASGSHYYTNGTCVLITYVDMALALPKQQFFGYKLDKTTGILYSYQADDKVDCSETSTWQPISDPTQIRFSEAPSDPLFSSPLNPKLIQIHLIAESMELSTGGVPVSRDVLVKVFIRNS